MQMREVLARVGSEFPQARLGPLKDAPLARFITHEGRQTLEGLVGSSFVVSASPGKGVWAEVPWLAVFEPSVTTTAQRGFYAVYLFSVDCTRVVLSLNQGTTEVRALAGKKYLQVLQQRATIDATILRSEDLHGLHLGSIDLGGTGDLSRGYESGNIAGINYTLSSLPTEDDLRADLARMLALYSSLIAARDDIESVAAEELPPDVKPGVEAQKFRWHRRAERNQRLANDAKRHHGYTCQACGFNFADTYGEAGHGYIEAHHITPFADLAARPEESVLDPRTDFVVLCANCHRMAHRVRPQYSIDEIRKMLSVEGSKPQEP